MKTKSAITGKRIQGLKMKTPMMRLLELPFSKSPTCKEAIGKSLLLLKMTLNTREARESSF